MNLIERDKAHLWHPLTQHKLYSSHLPIVKAEGSLLYDETGNTYIDAIASWYTCMYGHCNPLIIEKIKDQLQTLDHVVFSGFTHQPAIELSEKLIAILPSNQSKIFFSDNGSTAVDVAIKMAIQYFANKGMKRSKIIALKNAFHGDTFGGMSVSGLSIYNGPFEAFFLSVARIPVPSTENIKDVKEKFRELLEGDEVAAFIYEPLVQGAAGMQMYAPELLDSLLEIAGEKGIVCIADEVMTGFGKTGKNFASEYMEHQPDIICLSKSLTAGVAPMAITSCTNEVFEAFYDDDIKKGFFHGHTYSANPIGCAAAIAGIDLLLSELMQGNIRRIHQKHVDFEARIKKYKEVKTTRVLGVIFALELNINIARYGTQRDLFFNYYMENGVFLRPLGNTIYILPPFVISDGELNKVYSVIENSLKIV
jgi:adenosylmethionine-8-amino-7-oxononanoate aminotransferase